MSRLKTELSWLRRRGAVRTDDEDASRACGRCKAELGVIINRGAACRACRKRVCKQCREYTNNGRDWVCCVCHKHMLDMSVEEYEQSCWKKLEHRTNFYGNLIVFLQTGKHKKGLTVKDRKHVLGMVSSHHWDDADTILVICAVAHCETAIENSTKMTNKKSDDILQKLKDMENVEPPSRSEEFSAVNKVLSV